jgi:hypothetical protein
VERKGGADSEPDRILGPTRAGLGVLFALAIANGFFLYLVPSRAETDYAWAIVPPVSAAFMGAGYLAGAIATGLGVFVARRFGSVRALVPAFCVLGVLLLAATLIHADRFRWDYPPTWIWTAVYAAIPGVATYLALTQRRRAPVGAVSTDPGVASMRTPLVALGLALTAAAVALYIAPDALLERWPWEITPLLARVFGSWYALAGITLFLAGATARRPHELPIACATMAAWSALLLALPALYSESIDTSTALFWPWLGLHAVVLAVCGFGTLLASRRMRASAERF